jgi:hypothetical protein
VRKAGERRKEIIYTSSSVDIRTCLCVFCCCNILTLSSSFSNFSYISYYNNKIYTSRPAYHLNCLCVFWHFFFLRHFLHFRNTTTKYTQAGTHINRVACVYFVVVISNVRKAGERRKARIHTSSSVDARTCLCVLCCCGIEILLFLPPIFLCVAKPKNALVLLYI